MDRKVIQAQEKVASKAELEFGRKLTSEERKAIQGLDRQVVIHEVAGWDGKAVIELLESIVGERSPAKFLTSLATAHTSLQNDWRRILNFFDSNARVPIERVQSERLLDQFGASLSRVIRTAKPPSETRVIKFGLFEREGGCRVYVVGWKNNGANLNKPKTNPSWIPSPNLLELSWSKSPPCELWRQRARPIHHDHKPRIS